MYNTIFVRLFSTQALCQQLGAIAVIILTGRSFHFRATSQKSQTPQVNGGVTRRLYEIADSSFWYIAHCLVTRFGSQVGGHQFASPTICNIHLTSPMHVCTYDHGHTDDRSFWPERSTRRELLPLCWIQTETSVFSSSTCVESLVVVHHSTEKLQSFTQTQQAANTLQAHCTDSRRRAQQV